MLASPPITNANTAIRRPCWLAPPESDVRAPASGQLGPGSSQLRSGSGALDPVHGRTRTHPSGERVRPTVQAACASRQHHHHRWTDPPKLSRASCMLASLHAYTYIRVSVATECRELVTNCYAFACLLRPKRHPCHRAYWRRYATLARSIIDREILIDARLPPVNKQIKPGRGA